MDRRTDGGRPDGEERKEERMRVRVRERKREGQKGERICPCRFRCHNARTFEEAFSTGVTPTYSQS